MLNPKNRTHLCELISILLLAFFLESWLSEKIFMNFGCDETRAIIILENL